MELKKLGNSSVRVSPLTFGAWAIGGWLWGGAEDKDALRALRAAYDLGITSIDTAPIYGFGKSEELVGKAMEGVPRDRYQILTKYGLNWQTHQGEFYFDTFDRNDQPVKIYRYAAKSKVKQECEESLRRLKTDYIDLYQIHWSDSTTPISETMEAVAELIKEGKVRAAGVCNYSAQQADEALKTLSIVSNQIPYSMVHRNIEKSEVPQAMKAGIGILPYSPLQRGILTGKIKPDHKFNHGDSRVLSRYYKPENIGRINAMLERIKPIADLHRATLAQLVINWTLRQPAIASVLVGARDEKQVQDNARALDFKFSEEELTSIEKELGQLELID
jgi:aryl-alcohol dehydrogenase-like predicted oxidoreductase